MGDDIIADIKCHHGSTADAGIKEKEESPMHNGEETDKKEIQGIVEGNTVQNLLQETRSEHTEINEIEGKNDALSRENVEKEHVERAKVEEQAQDIADQVDQKSVEIEQVEGERHENQDKEDQIGDQVDLKEIVEQAEEDQAEKKFVRSEEFGNEIEQGERDQVEIEQAEEEEAEKRVVKSKEVEYDEEHIEIEKGEQIQGELDEGERDEIKKDVEEQPEEEEVVKEEEEPREEGEEKVQAEAEGEQKVEQKEEEDIVEEEGIYEEPPPDPAAPYDFTDSNEALKPHYELKPERLVEVEQLWELYQNYTPIYSDIDGYITEKELVYMLKSLLIMTYTPEQLQELIDFCVRPPHPKGHINFNQFVKMVTLRQRDFPYEEELRAALQVLDPQKTGIIDREYMREVLYEKGYDMNHKQLDSLIKEVDVAQDGTIGIEDVVGTMCIDLNTDDIMMLRASIYPEQKAEEENEQLF